jgi:hypothetical protein
LCVTRLQNLSLRTGNNDFSWRLGDVLYDTNGSTSYTPGFAQWQGSTSGGQHLWRRGLGSQRTGGTGGTTNFYSFDLQGNICQRLASGLLQDLDVLWDGDDRLRQVNNHATSSLFFSALYDGDGVRVKKTDTRGALGLQVNDFSHGPTGLLWSSNPNTVHTPGFGHRNPNTVYTT